MLFKGVMCNLSSLDRPKEHQFILSSLLPASECKQLSVWFIAARANVLLKNALVIIRSLNSNDS